MHGDADLVDLEVRVRADDCPPAKVDSFTREVASEPALLALESLNKTSQGPIGSVNKRLVWRGLGG